MKIYDVIIVGVALFEFLGLVGLYGTATTLFILFVFSWLFIAVSPYHSVKNILGYFGVISTDYLIPRLSLSILYLSCSILAWISIPLIVKYTKGVPLWKRVLYIYFVPQLIMGITCIFFPPLH